MSGPGPELPVVGCDPSLNGTALHLSGGERFSVSDPKLKKLAPVPRIKAIRDRVLEKLVGPCGILAIEGIPFGTSTGSAMDRAGLSYAIRIAAYERGWSILDINPSVLKKYITGKGNAQKDSVRMHLMKNPWCYESTDNNDADAWALRRIGIEWVDWMAGVATPAYKAEMLKKLSVTMPDR